MVAGKKNAVKRADTFFEAPKAAAPAEKTMSSYRALLAQRADLEAKIAAARDEEVAHALEQIRNIVDEYDLHDEVQFTRGGRRAKPGPGIPRAPVAAKYRDPDSGATWSGRGKPPAWIAGKDRQQFLVD